MRAVVLLVLLTCVLLVPPSTSAQLSTTTDTEEVPIISTLDVSASSADLLVFGDSIFQPDYVGTQEELPGLGHKFELFGAMVRDTDPDNPVGSSGSAGGGAGGNETISATIVPVPFTLAFAFRNLPTGIKIAALDNQLGLKYFFVNRTCGGGSPRVTLLVDSDGDGDFDFAAHGHLNPPFLLGCPSNVWRYEDLTDPLKRWETTPATILTPLPCGPAGGATTCTWDELEARITAQFPNHKVLSAFLLDGESCSFFGGACGRAFYDLVTIENRTLEIWQDTVKK